ncbi:Translocon-associated protein subunit delta [Trichinella nativa]|uniref:Translocon-associated protein subunit delta n=1 Tax=Trichinella nativa TaxID=6335 RepID=A0A0V1L255_9BILA|nr:Translocon-associated protein subunit delta [Trichinella nativa]
MWLLCSFLCFFLISSCIADTCRNPTLVKHSGYSTTDSFFNAKTAIVIEFSVNCDQPVKEYPLYWEYEGDVHLAAQLPTGLHYQITFVNDHKKIGRGQYDIRIFDEEGFAALRKAMRAKVDTNEAVKPLFTVSYYHPGSTGEPRIASQTIVLAASAVGRLILIFQLFVTLEYASTNAIDKYAKENALIELSIAIFILPNADRSIFYFVLFFVFCSRRLCRCSDS